MSEENNKTEYIILVDEKGARLGTEEKEKCHEGKGLLHSAFLVIILNEEFEILLTRRSRLKKLWPGYWDGSVASHFTDRLHPMDKIKERIQQEIGVIRSQFKYLTRFRYQSEYKDSGSENEVCDIYLVDNVIEKEIVLNKDEISEYRFVGQKELIDEIKKSSKEYTPWFLIALEKYRTSHKTSP
jgi:isopentenyl-diphosphate delta-isomerase